MTGYHWKKLTKQPDPATLAAILLQENRRLQRENRRLEQEKQFWQSRACFRQGCQS